MIVFWGAFLGALAAIVVVVVLVFIMDYWQIRRG